MSDQTNDELYRKLQQFLDTQPCGFPSAESGSDIENLKWMFTPRQAEVEISMGSIPERAETIARRCGRPVQEVSEILESMVSDGLIMPIRDKSRTFYMTLHYMVGFGENQQSHRMSPERAELLTRWAEESGFIRDFTRQKQLRVIPIRETVDVPRAPITAYNDIRDVIRKQDVISVTPCCCRVMRKNLGNVCDRPIENELAFGFFARYRIDTGFGREISQAEAIKIIEEADDNAMVLSPVNAREPVGMCICCSCCCYWLEALKHEERPVDFVQSSYQAHVGADDCNECGTCIERCQMEAITERDGAIRVDLDRCIGCGLCVTHCDQKAMTLVARSDVGEPPGSYVSALAGVAGRRNLPMGKNARLFDKVKIDPFVAQWKVLNRLHLAQPVARFMQKMGRL